MGGGGIGDKPLFLSGVTHQNSQPITTVPFAGLKDLIAKAIGADDISSQSHPQSQVEKQSSVEQSKQESSKNEIPESDLRKMLDVDALNK